jgi:putative membrane protein
MMRTRLLAALAVLALVVFLAPLAVAAQGAGGDAKFVVTATATGMAEVQFGKLAEKQASSPEVRKFAKQMVEGYTKANKELNDLAFAKKWNVAAAMDRNHQAAYDRLTKFEGADFDREYMKGQVKDHEDAVRLVEDQAKNGDDAQLREWANKALPHVREHLKTAKECAEKLGTGK